MIQAYAYLWLAPELAAPQQQLQREARGQSLEAFCHEQGWSWQGLQVDQSLNPHPARRPVLKQLLKRLQAEDILLVQSLLDLGRRFHDAHTLMQLFRQTGSLGSLVAVKQNLRFNRQAGSEILNALAKIPQLNSEQPETLSVQATAYQRSELSRNNGGACPYGYQIHAESNEYELIAAEAKVVRQIFKLRAKGQSLRQIALKLTHEGSRTKRGGRWHANTIKAILENPFYTGAYQTHYARFEHHHPEIISPALYYEINAHLLCDDIAL